MAFEGAFGNIDWGMATRARQAEADRLQQAIGQGLAIAQQKEERDFKRRQLEQREAEKQAAAEADIRAQSDAGLMVLASGGTPTDIQKRAMDVTAAKMQPTARLDPSGVPVVTQPIDPRTRLGSAIGTPSSPSPVADSLAPDVAGALIHHDPSLLSPQPVPVQDRFAPPAPVEIIDDGAISLLSPEQFQQAKVPQLEGPLAGTPKGKIMEAQAGLDVQKEALKSEIQENKARRKEAMEKEKGIPKAEKRVLSLYDSWENANAAIDAAIESVSSSTSGIGSLTSFIPGTPAKDLEAKLKTIKADAAFGALQEMRDNSKTGGALGQVSERELGLLESSVAALGQDQSPAQLQDNLARYKAQKVKSLRLVRDAYEKDYGYIPEGLMEIKETPDPRGIENISPEARLNRYEELIKKRGM